jgi:hypothetical protein
VAGTPPDARARALDRAAGRTEYDHDRGYERGASDRAQDADYDRPEGDGREQRHWGDKRQDEKPKHEFHDRHLLDCPSAGRLA